MCIIIAKNKNGRLPNEEELKNSFEYNSDGAGFMYVDNGKVVIDKGYMTYDSFIKHYHKLLQKYNNFNNKSLVIHCRIGTSGKNTKGNTHPYPITNKQRLLKSKKVYTDEIGIVHNGIIRGYGTINGLNDTQEYISKYLYPLYKNYEDFYKNEGIRENIAISTGSKFAILENTEKIYLIGEFIEDNGLYFSNETYKPYRFKYSYYDYSDYYQESFDDEMIEEELFPLEDNWFVDMYGNGNTIIVGEKELYFNYITGELYEYKNNEFCMISKNAMIYDENYDEVF